jgi:hypothetical protein
MSFTTDQIDGMVKDAELLKQFGRNVPDAILLDVVLHVKALASEVHRQEMLLIRKSEALAIFASPRQWLKSSTLYSGYWNFLWNGDNDCRDPMAFARRESDAEDAYDTGFPIQRCDP